MKKRIFKFLKKQAPKILNYLKSQADNEKANKHIQDAGKAAKEIHEAIILLEKYGSDNIITQEELQKLMLEMAEAFLAIANLFGITEIKLRRNNK